MKEEAKKEVWKKGRRMMEGHISHGQRKDWSDEKISPTQRTKNKTQTKERFQRKTRNKNKNKTKKKEQGKVVDKPVVVRTKKRNKKENLFFQREAFLGTNKISIVRPIYKKHPKISNKLSDSLPMVWKMPFLPPSRPKVINLEYMSD